MIRLYKNQIFCMTQKNKVNDKYQTVTYNSHKELLSLVYKNLLKINKDKDTKPIEKKDKEYEKLDHQKGSINVF